MNYRIVAIAAVLCLTFATWRLVRAADPATAAASQPAPASQASARSMQEIMADLRKISTEAREVISPSLISDADKRKELAPKALPTIKKMIALGKELQAGEAKQMGDQILSQLRPIAALLGDTETVADLETQAKGADAKQATSAKATLLLSRYWQNSKDAAAQSKVLDEAETLAKANPENQEVAQALMGMSQIGEADKKNADRATDIIVANMKGDFVSGIKEEVDAQKKIRSFENKPLTIKGPDVSGKEFSTDQWKGKVILVDFWATWCGPCIGELPRVKKAYEDHHAKGLEILGVSNDYAADDLKKFLEKDPKMAWPQLFDAAAAQKQEWNPITTGFGIHGIPTMFLIDKKGVLRSVDARGDFEQQIPKLLAE